MALPVFRYINLDGNLYPIATDTYSMKWARAFTSQLAGNIVRLNFIDRGPGVRVYDMTIILNTWPATSAPFTDGITGTWDTQLQALEASYGKIAKILSFTDPFGRNPGPSANNGVYFTNYNLVLPKYLTPQKAVALAEIELTEATQLVN